MENSTEQASKGILRKLLRYRGLSRAGVSHPSGGAPHLLENLRFRSDLGRLTEALGSQCPQGDTGPQNSLFDAIFRVSVKDTRPMGRLNDTLMLSRPNASLCPPYP